MKRALVVSTSAGKKKTQTQNFLLNLRYTKHLNVSNLHTTDFDCHNRENTVNFLLHVNSKKTNKTLNKPNQKTPQSWICNLVPQVKIWCSIKKAGRNTSTALSHHFCRKLNKSSGSISQKNVTHALATDLYWQNTLFSCKQLRTSSCISPKTSLNFRLLGIW